MGINEPYELASILHRARIVVASIQKTENAPALKAKGWLDADTQAFEGLISGLASTDLTQETGKDATGQRNHNANELSDHLLTIQNAADLQWPEDNPANAGIRDAFRLSTFPPRGGNRGKDIPPQPPRHPHRRPHNQRNKPRLLGENCLS